MLHTWSIWNYNVRHLGSAERYWDLSWSKIWYFGNVVEIICTVKNIKCVDEAISCFIFTRLNNTYIYIYIYIYVLSNIYQSSLRIQSSLIYITPIIISTPDMSLLQTETVGRVGVVSIAARYKLRIPGIECRWGGYFPQTSKPALGPTQPPMQWTPAHSRHKRSGPGVENPTHLAPRRKKEYSCTCNL